MKTHSLWICCAALIFAACSTPDSRIQSNQTAFNQLSPTDQAKIREGHIDIGFTPEMVVMALGEPDRRITQTSAQGASDIWIYRSHGGHFSFGFGVAGGNHSGGTAAGVAVGGGDQNDTRVRVIFQNQRVSAIEQRSGR